MSTATVDTTSTTADTPAGRRSTPAPPGSGAAAALPRPHRLLLALGRGARRSAAVVLFLLLWELGPQYLLDPARKVFLPPLHVVLQAWWGLVEDGQLQQHLTASLARSATGFGVAVVAGVALGLVVAWYDGLRELLTPLLELFRNTAALALLPVFVLLLGIGETSKVSIVAYASFFPVLLNTIAGVRTVDPLLVRAARSLGLNSLQLFQKVVLPSAVPTIFTGIRMAGTASILVLIAAEMVGAKAGLGYLIVNAQSSFQIPDMYAGILTVSLFGLVVNTVLVRVEQRFSRWRVAASGR
ncbi:MAG: ABC transporter permease [Oryzihumus sp.]